MSDTLAQSRTNCLLQYLPYRNQSSEPSQPNPLMKILNRILAASLLVAGISLPALGAENVVIKFNDASESTFARWWGGAVQTYEHDAAVDADSDASSGAQKIIVNYDLAAYGGDNQFAAFRNFAATIDARDYTNLTFDVRFDPASPSRAGGDYGWLEFGLGPTDFSQIQLGALGVPVSQGGWYRISVPLDKTVAKMDSIGRFWVKIWSGGGDGFTGTTTLWVDNVTLNANQDVAPPAPPTVAIAKATPGLQLFASQAGAQYSRQNIYTVNSTGYSWVGAADPVTYSVTLANYPDASHSGFQTHIFLVPGSGIPTFENSVDYNRPNVIFLDIGNGADGTAYASFRYKTNQPNGNGMIYGAGTLGGVGSPTPNGTWSLTFSGNTAITLTSPSGATTSLELPADAAALFADPLHVYVGAQPNQLGNIGQSVTVTRVQITGVATPIDDTFSAGALDTAVWRVSAGDAAGVLTVPTGYTYWLNWSLPDDGFTFEYITGDVVNGVWQSAPGLSTPLQVGSRRWSLIPSSLEPFPGEGFFYRMAKPAPAAQ